MAFAEIYATSEGPRSWKRKSSRALLFYVFIMVAMWKERAGKIGGKDEKKGGSCSRFMSNRFDVDTDC